MIKKYDLDKRNAMMFIACLIGFAFLARMAIGVGYFNSFDTDWYKGWAVDLPNGIFDIYTRADSINLDYPPLYLFPLYLVGLVYKAIGANPPFAADMLLMKFFPIVFDVLCIWLLYIICTKHGGRAVGLFAATMWAINPSAFFNSAAWGQTDGLMAFLLLLAFYYLQEDRPIAAGIAMAVACLTKFQCIAFVPVYLLELIRRRNYKKLSLSIGAAAATGIVVFIPFCIGSGNIRLPFDLYLGGASSYSACTLHAFNIYSAFGLNSLGDRIPDSRAFLGPVTFNNLSMFLAALSLILLVYVYVRGKRTSGWVGGLMFMQCVFMLTTRMHERYQFIVLPFALMAYITTRRKGFFKLFAALSVMTLFNQALLLIMYNYHYEVPWYGIYGSLVIFFSLINIGLFIWTLFECITFFFKDKKGTGQEKSDSLQQTDQSVSPPVI